MGPNPEIELCCNTKTNRNFHDCVEGHCVPGDQNSQYTSYTDCMDECGGSNNLYCTIPDADFRNRLIMYGYVNAGDFNGNQIAMSLVNTIPDLDMNADTSNPVDYPPIADLTGIECFTALTFLTCTDNQLTSLDVSQNTNLTYLSCGYNQLESLNVSGATALTNLWCHDNQLTSLDVSQNTALTHLGCGFNQIGDNGGVLDVSQNTLLTYLSCDSSQLTSLDVSQNTALTLLGCSDNPLGSLDVSQNTDLIDLMCWNNQLVNLNVNMIPSLNQLRCYNNNLATLNIENTSITDCGMPATNDEFDATANPNVEITINLANAGNYGTCVDSTATFITV